MRFKPRILLRCLFWSSMAGFVYYVLYSNYDVLQQVDLDERIVSHNTRLAECGIKNQKYSGPQPEWQKRALYGPTKSDNSSYFLTSLLKVRIYESDRGKWTIRELKQWMHYMFWAGVERIYICDRRQNESERLDLPLKKYIDLGLVTYTNQFSNFTPPSWAQTLCYKALVTKYRNNHAWQIAFDIDEIPFVYNDTAEGFLVRYLQGLDQNVTELSLDNFVMLGQGDRKRDIVFERINRLRPRPLNRLVKPIYRPARIKTAGVHKNTLLSGKRMKAPHSRIKMLHYWGARGQNFGPDTNETYRKSVEFNEVREKLGPILRNSLVQFGENDAFSCSTGP